MSAESRVELHLPPEPIAPALARAGIAEVAARLPRDVAGDLEVLATEVVANAVKHADLGPTDEIVLRVSLDDVVRVEVTDDGPGFDRQTPALPRDDARGWGLYLVEQLATAWGVEREGGCNRVWFHLDAQPSPSGKPAG